jgi:hypothetical protein
VGGVSERLADLPDAEIQALLEIHEGVATPDVFPDLVAGHDFAAAPDQELEDLQRLGRQLHEVAVLAQLPRSGLQLERPEAKDVRRAHRKLISNSGRIYGSFPCTGL